MAEPVDIMVCCKVPMNMKQIAVKPVICLIGLWVIVVFGNHHHHVENTTVQKPPSDLRPLLKSMLTRSISLKPYGQCSTQVQQSDVKLLLYTQNSIHRPVTLNVLRPTQIDPRKKVIFIIHGWLSSPSTFGFPNIKDAYLKRYDCNVIMVDWSFSAAQVYKKAYCAIPQIGQMLSNFLCLLQRQLRIPVNSVHMVGHSFGAQMSAFTSQDTVVTCGQQVGRITAMDPARPHYQGISTSLRLDRDDAVFVDVIHTNDGVFGYIGDCGHVDFYVNCGSLQPGCPTIDIADWLDHPIAAVSCEHFRSVEFMAESISSDKFKGKLCSSCHLLCSPDQTSAEEVTMGEDCPRNATGSYVVFTNSKPPYAMG